MSKFSISCLVLHIYATFRSVCSADSASTAAPACHIPILNVTGVCVSPNFCHDFHKERFYYENLPVCEYGPAQQITQICCPPNKVCSGARSNIKCLQFYPHTAAAAPPYGYTVEDIMAGEKEFPHMAAIGFGNKSEIDWLCGGTILDARFVITAAHCTTSDRGSPTWIRVGTLNISSPTNATQDIAVSQVYIHPIYKRASVYNDIAILRLAKDIEFYSHYYEYVKRACLQTGPLDLRIGDQYWERQLEATGWGATSFLGERSYHLLKVNLSLVDDGKCRERYKPDRRMTDGIRKGQICAGSPLGADTCQGDSGGPLHYRDHNGANEYFVLVGITSFGKACGLEDAIGVYTRVSEYVTWIEDIVWPTEETVISFD